MKLARPVILALICGLLLAAANQRMYPVIADNRQHFEEKVLRDMVDGRPLEKTIDGWTILEAGTVAGSLRTVTAPDGYNGNIELFIARDLEGHLIRVRAAHHKETPGIGDVIEPGVSDWIGKFDGLSADQIAGVDTISGATITTRAVRRAVQNAFPGEPDS